MDSVNSGDSVLILDDLLATGGTILAACELLRRLGAKIVGLGFVIELTFLRGRQRLPGYEVFSIVSYDSE